MKLFGKLRSQVLASNTSPGKTVQNTYFLYSFFLFHSLSLRIREEYQSTIMRWLVSCFLLVLLALAQALSSSGNRLLVVIEEAAEKEKYSQFWDDLEGAPGACEFSRTKADNTNLKAGATSSLSSLPRTKNLRCFDMGSAILIISSFCLRSRKAGYFSR